MRVSRDTVRHLARLARVAVAEEDLSALTADLQGILGAAERLLAAELPEVPPRTAPVTLAADVARRVDPEPLLATAPSLRESLFALPPAVPQGDRDR